MSTMTETQQSPFHQSARDTPSLDTLQDPVLIMLPDGGVRLYHADDLRAADVTQEYPGCSLSNRAGGQRRPALDPIFPLRPGGTYFLVPGGTGSAGRRPGRRSLDSPASYKDVDPGTRCQEFDIEDFRAELRRRSQTLPGRSSNTQIHSRHTESANAGTSSRLTLCPYCAPQGTFALSATWQLCAAHVGGRKVVRSTSQTSVGSSQDSKTPRQTPHMAQSDWLDDESCCVSITSPQGMATPVLMLSVPPAQERRVDSLLEELRLVREPQLQAPMAQQQQQAAFVSTEPPNPILEELWEMERSSTASRIPTAAGINPILEELWDLEEVEETQNAASSREGGKSGPTKKAFGRFLNGVKRVASWKSRGAKSSEDVLADPPQRRGDLDTWNALPSSFTSV